MSAVAFIIIDPTKTSVQPVAQGGTVVNHQNVLYDIRCWVWNLLDANIGAKKIEMKKHIPVTIAVMPVLPPSEIPAPDSIYAVTGGEPKSDPMEIPKASTVYATAEPSKSTHCILVLIPRPVQK